MEVAPYLQLIYEMTIFIAVIVMNLLKKNSGMVRLYCLQSVALVTLLSIQAYQEAALGLILLIISTFVIKVVLAPRIFMRFIRHSHENISATTYLKTPLTIAVLVLLAAFSQSDVFVPLFAYLPHAAQPGLLLVGSLLMSLFLIINRKGVLTQIIGVLSLENCIFTIGHFLPIKLIGDLELGILFAVCFWIIISSLFVAMIYRHYRSLDITALQELQK